MNKINQLIIGQQVIESGEHQKRVLLAGYLILIYLATGAFWLILGLFDEFADNSMTLAGFFVNILCFFILRKGWFYTGTFIFLIRINGVTAYYSWLYPNTSSALFFMTCGLGGLAVFGYEKRGIGITYSLLSILLYLFLTTDLELLIIGSDHFHHQSSLLLTYISLSLLIYFFNFVTFQYNQVIQQQNETLAKTNGELDRFVYTASHDLKAPLNSIVGLLNIIKLTDDSKEIKSIFHRIEKSVEALRNFIGEVTTYSRNTRTEVVWEKVNLHNLAEEIHNSLAFDEKAKRVAWKNNVPKEMHFSSDTYRLRIALNNLLSHAFKYADLTKKDPFVEIHTLKTGSSIVITIADNGIGLSVDSHPKLFQMFYRATDKETGSGLGLYIAKESVEKLGGRIQIKSELDKGTSFTVTVPLVG
jgi:signal transduction histidine kinase